MASSKTTKPILTFTIFLVAAGAATAILIHLWSPQRIALANGRHAIENHIAEPADLTTYYGTPASRFDQITAFPAWKAVPRGFQTFLNVPLQIDGMICLWGDGNAKMGLDFPTEVPGIEVNKKFETLYIYHACFFTSPSGTPVYEVVFHYDDGSSLTNEIRYGVDVLDWYANGKTVAAPTGPNSQVAWSGDSVSPGKTQRLRFCLTALENPQPNLKVTSLDLVSSKSRTAGCIMAMTPGKSGLMRSTK